MDDDDEAALLPYAGMVACLSTLSSALASVPAVGDLDTPLTGEHQSDGSDSEVGVFGGATLSRVDGEAMDGDDDAALLEFGGLATMFSILTSTPLIGDIEASPTGGAKSCGPRSEPFGAVSRKDGEAMDSGDDDALLEFAPLFYLHLAGSSVFGDADEAHCLGVFASADDDLAAWGEQWGKDHALAQSKDNLDTWAGALQRADGSRLDDDDDEALLHYGAWARGGSLLLGIWSRTVGSLGAVGALQSHSQSGGSKGGNGAQPQMKRKPSGAELSAYLGYAAQKGMGLSDPARKVRARNIM
jgi:hypothetical protein